MILHSEFYFPSYPFRIFWVIKETSEIVTPSSILYNMDAGKRYSNYPIILEDPQFTVPSRYMIRRFPEQEPRPWSSIDCTTGLQVTTGFPMVSPYHRSSPKATRHHPKYGTWTRRNEYGLGVLQDLRSNTEETKFRVGTEHLGRLNEGAYTYRYSRYTFSRPDVTRSMWPRRGILLSVGTTVEVKCVPIWVYVSLRPWTTSGPSMSRPRFRSPSVGERL